jgi:hypothetical protein
MPAQKAFAYTPITIPPVDHPTADQLLILGDIRSLEARVVQRELWSAASVRELLQAAANAATIGGDPAKAREAFAKAEIVFQNDVQTKNRMFYLVGIAFGLIAIGVLAGSVLGVAHWLKLIALARPEMVIDLFAFAGLGSLTSVLARLSTIDLKDELRRKWVVISAGVRPIMAVSFAAITYLLLNFDLVTFSGFDTPGKKKALIWIAAFLCGYSERFAQDLLDRLPFTKSDERSAGS